MLVEEIAPTEIGKHANVIKAAQEDLTVMDVLVCGRCFHVCHFIEDYQDHKEQSACEDNENLRKGADTKPGIWAFLLWKAAQLNSKKELASTSSWSLYQSWVKLEDSVRETWIVAGKTIQSFGKLGQGELQEMPVRITKTVVNNANSEGSPNRKPSPQSKTAISNIKDIEQDKKPATTSTTNPKQSNRIARRTLPGTNETVAEKVEKIVAKRFNPKRKQHEYMVKWDGGEPLDNSWEPASNLEDVPHFLELFEKQLARQKQSRAALNASKNLSSTNKLGESTTAPLRKLPNINTAEHVPVSSTGSPSRPPRTSKTKAMDQVKQWVNESTNAGSTSPSSATEEEVMQENEKDWSMNSTNSPLAVSGVKRKLQDSDLNDSNASDSALGGTTSTMEDLEEDLIPSHTVKRLKNGSSISVEVKTKNEKNVEKVIKVNGTAGARTNTSVTGEVLQVGANSADVIITQDSSASGVMRKQGATSTKPEKPEALIRMLTKAESLVSNTGIVRTSAAEESKTIANTAPARVQQMRAVGGVSSTSGRSTPTQAVQRQPLVTQPRTPGGTVIQRRTVSTAPLNSPKSGLRVSQTPVRNTQHTAVGASGRLIISRTTGNATPTPTRTLTTVANKNVTPEEKIFNLSKSGDLKVTKKVMTREELRAAQQQRLQQQQRQPQTQVQIQKVQQIAPPRQRVTGSTTSPNMRTHTAASVVQTTTVATAALPQEEEEHQAQLCPITGKLIGQEETQLQMEQEQQQEQQEQEQQQQLQALLGGDQQMLTNEDGSPLLVRGEDGTVYQVAGKNAEGQTILVTQGPDGEQQFAYVAAAEGEENQVLTLDNAVAEAVAQLPAEQQAEALAAAAAGESGQYLVQMTEEELVQHQAALQAQQETSGDAAAATTQLTIQTGDGSDGQEANIPAEVVQADLPSPGGTRRVVLLLSDGTFMMTEMHDDEFKALNIAT